MTDLFMYEIASWWNYPLLTFFFLVVVMYFIGTRKYTAGKIRFLLSIGLIALCFATPMYGISHLWFSVHMGQMAILFFIVPPLLLAGIPAELIRKWKNIDSFMKPLHILFKHPMVIMFLFSALFAIYHIPIVFDTVMTNSFLYVTYHIILMITAIGMWIPLLSPLSHYFENVKRKKYLRLSSMIISPACLLLILAFVPLYQTFNDPETWQQALDACFGLNHLENMKSEIGLPTMMDQRLGGVIMVAFHKISHLDMGRRGIFK